MDGIIKKIIEIDNYANNILFNADDEIKKKNIEFEESIKNLHQEYKIKTENECNKIEEKSSLDTQREIDLIESEYKTKKDMLLRKYNKNSTKIIEDLIEEITKMVK